MPSVICDPPPEHLPRLWDQIEPCLKKAITRSAYLINLYEPLDILLWHVQGRVKIWISWNQEESRVEAAMVSRILDYPKGRTCSVFLVGGRNLRGWSEKFIQTIEAYAKAQKCIGMESGGRRGWARVAGYRETGTTLYKELV